MSRGRDGLYELLVEIPDDRGRHLAARGAHLALGERLAGGLVLAARSHPRPDADVIEEPLQKDDLGSDPGDVQGTAGGHHDLARAERHEVAGQPCLLHVDDHPLARVADAAEGDAQLLGAGKAGIQRPQLHEHGAQPVVSPSSVERSQQV